MELNRPNRSSEMLAELSPPDESESLWASPHLGRYRLLACLGRGGMGDVFLAVSQGLGGFNKLVVVKQLRAHLTADPEFVAMFLDEARLAARFNHPNIVQTNEVGKEMVNRYFIAMEHLDGQPYDRVLHRAHALGGPPVPLQLHVLNCVLDALHYAHRLKAYEGAELNFVHRDISPQNVFLTYQGECKVLDFGVAKALGSTVHTGVGSHKGKLAFMAPEQMQGDAVDRRADLFAVGVMLWTALAGRSPWQGMVNIEIGRRLFAGDIPSVRQAVRDVDDVLASICERAMAPEPAARYQTAGEMRTDLDAYLESRGLQISRGDLAEMLQKLFARDRMKMERFVQERIRQLGTFPAGAEEALPILESAAPAPAPAPDVLWAPREPRRVALGAGREAPWGDLKAALLACGRVSARGLKAKLEGLQKALPRWARASQPAIAEAFRAVARSLVPPTAICPWKHVRAAAALFMAVVLVAGALFMRERRAHPMASAPVVVRIPAIELRASVAPAEPDLLDSVSDDAALRTRGEDERGHSTR